MSQPSIPKPIALTIQLAPCTESFAHLLRHGPGGGDEGHCQVVVTSPNHSVTYNVHLTAAEARHLFAETSRLAALANEMCAAAKKRSDEEEAKQRAAEQQGKKEDASTPN